MKFEVIEWAWGLLLITFSMSFPIILRRKMGQNVLEVLYDSLLDFGIIIDVKFLKWEGQWLKLMHKFAILTILVIHLSSLTNI